MALLERQAHQEAPQNDSHLIRDAVFWQLKLPFEATFGRDKAAAYILAGEIVAGLVMHHTFAPPEPDDKATIECVDAGHQRIQIGGNSKLQNNGQAIVDLFWGLPSAAKDIVGEADHIGYTRTLEATTREMQKNAGYSLSPERVAQVNSDLFIKDGKIQSTPAAYGDFCMNVPGPVVYGFSEADGEKTVGELRDHYQLSTEQFANLNPGLPTDADAKPDKGLIIKWKQNGEYDASIFVQPLAEETIADTIDGKNPQKRAERLASNNAFALIGEEKIKEGDDIYLEAEPTKYHKDHGITVEDIVNEYEQDYKALDTNQSVEPKIKVKQIEDKPDDSEQGTESSVENINIDDMANNEISPMLEQLMIDDLVSHGVPAEYAKMYVIYGAKHGSNPYLLAAQGKKESLFNPRAKNDVTGAAGIAQMMTATWNEIVSNATGLNLNFPKDASAYNPRYAIEAQAVYMRWIDSWLISQGVKGPRDALALAAYNAGIGNVRDAGGVPNFSETKNYNAVILETTRAWGEPGLYYNQMLRGLLKPAMYDDITETPSNPLERQAYIASKLGISKEAVILGRYNGLYQFDIDSAVGAKALDIPAKGGYPEKYDNAPKGSLIDEWRMYSRECVSYVAHRVSNDGFAGEMPVWGGVDNQPDTPGHQSGHAMYWADNARAAGIPVDDTPAVGSVVAWNRNGVEHDWKGHVAYVEALLPDGNIVVSQYNNNGEGFFSFEVLTKPYLEETDNQVEFIHFEQVR